MDLKDLITYNLKSKAVNYDISIFNKYYDGELSLQDCKYLWAKHNRVCFDDYEKISDELFKEWLDSLGYKR